MKATQWLAIAVSLGMLAVVGCGDKDPVSSTRGARDAAGKLTISANKVAGTCELPGCRPGQGTLIPESSGPPPEVVVPGPEPEPEPEPEPTPEPGPAPGGELTVTLPGGVEMEFVWIEPGTFVMGSPSSEPGRYDKEGPQHEVTISRGFYLGKYEITQGQWEGVMGTTPWSGQSYVRANPSHPAVYISWDDMQDFVQRLNQAAGEEIYRLPTEAEWEYAARAGTTTQWSFGDDESQLGDYAWYRDNAWNAGLEYAQPVGTKLPNPWGLYDMHGNVMEWVQDWWGSYSSGAQTDPTGPASGFFRFTRGGYFAYDARDARSAYRGVFEPSDRRHLLGARLLRTP